MLEPPRTTRWTFGKLHVLHVKWRKWDSKVRKGFLLPCLSIVGTEVGSEFFTLCRIPFVLYSLVFFDIDKIFFILISTDDFFFSWKNNSFFFMSSSLHCCLTADWLKPIIREVILLWFKDSRRWRTLHLVSMFFQCDRPCRWSSGLWWSCSNCSTF